MTNRTKVATRPASGKRAKPVTKAPKPGNGAHVETPQEMGHFIANRIHAEQEARELPEPAIRVPIGRDNPGGVHARRVSITVDDLSQLCGTNFHISAKDTITTAALNLACSTLSATASQSRAMSRALVEAGGASDLATMAEDIALRIERTAEILAHLGHEVTP